MVMPYTHITQVLLAEVKTRDQDRGFENIPSFVFVTFFFLYIYIYITCHMLPYSVASKCVDQHGLVWTLSLAISSSCLREAI